MKLEMTLPERPGFLHAVPILNIFALVQLFFLLGPSLVLQSGVAVDLAPSRFQMERYQDSIVVTLGPGEPGPRIHFGRDAVTVQELSDRLDKLRAEGAPTKAIVLLQTDTGTPVGIEREVTELVLDKGFRLALVGKSPPAGMIPSLKKAAE
jgi:biopolymer transport protein ExbD